MPSRIKCFSKRESSDFWSVVAELRLLTCKLKQKLLSPMKNFFWPFRVTETISYSKILSKNKSFLRILRLSEDHRIWVLSSIQLLLLGWVKYCSCIYSLLLIQTMNKVDSYCPTQSPRSLIAPHKWTECQSQKISLKKFQK